MMPQENSAWLPFLQPSLQGRRILLVEDELHWQAIVSHTLRDLDNNVQIRCVRSAEGAQEILKASSHYDLIIADQLLRGDLTGMDLWKSCRSNNLQIPFVFMSGLKEDKFYSLAAFEGVAMPAYVEKPLDSKKLTRVVLENFAAVPPSFRNHARAGLVLASLVVVTLLSFHDVVPTNIPTNEMRKVAQNKIQTDQGVPQPVNPQHPGSPMEGLITPQLKTQMERILKKADQLKQILAEKETKTSLKIK